MLWEKYVFGHFIATLGPEEKPILSQRDEGWAEEWLYFHQPANIKDPANPTI